jgi:hypothetical protein
MKRVDTLRHQALLVRQVAQTVESIRLREDLLVASRRLEELAEEVRREVPERRLRPINDPGMRFKARSIAATCEEIISDLWREEHATRVPASESAYESARTSWASAAGAAYRAPI